jgi:hypothetical protein
LGSGLGLGLGLGLGSGLGLGLGSGSGLTALEEHREHGRQQLVRDDAGGALRLLYEQQAHEAHDGAAQGAGAAPEQRVHRVPHAVVLQREGEG